MHLNIYAITNISEGYKIQVAKKVFFYAFSKIVHTADKESVILGKAQTVRPSFTTFDSRLEKVGKHQPRSLGILSVYLCT